MISVRLDAFRRTSGIADATAISPIDKNAPVPPRREANWPDSAIAHLLFARATVWIGSSVRSTGSVIIVTYPCAINCYDF